MLTPMQWCYIVAEWRWCVCDVSGWGCWCLYSSVNSCRVEMLCVMIQGGDADTYAAVLYSCRIVMVCVMFQDADADTYAAVWTVAEY